MRDLTLRSFDGYRNQIRRFRDMNDDWDKIKFRGNTEKDLENFIKQMEIMLGWDITAEEWMALVDLEHKHEIEKNNISFYDKSSIISEFDEFNEVVVPEVEESCWQCYKNYLLDEQKFAERDVNAIEDSSKRILQRLNGDTRGDAVKGLVIGNVQSGKTANMAGLMAMAADYGWNMFIVLSGTIENLRIQTLNRMVNDLGREGSNFEWHGISHPSKNCDTNYKTQHLYFQKNSRARYLTVSLKHSKRLENLINWLHDDPKTMEQMKIMVIDDEADQAGINTGDREERKKINNLLVKLVNNLDADGNETKNKFLSMNYIGYTDY